MSIDSIKITHGVKINGARCNIYTVIEAGCSTTP